jgi:hydroxyethylthiazole kinase-like sugar kinase family protein
MSIQVQPVNIQHIHSVWNAVEPFIKSAEEKSGDVEYTAEQVKVYLITGQWQLLVVVTETQEICGAIVVNYISYPSDRVAFITAIGGKSIATEEGYNSMCQVLRSFGVTKIQGVARESVARLWQRLGFKERAILVEAKL